MQVAWLVVLSLAVGLQSEPGYADIRKQLAHLLSEHYPLLPQARRDGVADMLATGIVKAGEAGRNRHRVLAIVKGQLQSNLGFVGDVRDYGLALASALKTSAPEAGSALVLPQSFFVLEGERSLSAVGNYVAEAACAPPPSEQDLSRLRSQLESVQTEIAAQARTLIYGAYRDAVIEKALQLSWAGVTESLGDSVAGGLTRPLSAMELSQLLDRIKSSAGNGKPVEASTSADLGFSETGQVDVDQATEAVRLALRLSKQLHGFEEFNYPRTVAAERELYAVSRDAKKWMDSAFAPINARLKKAGITVEPVLTPPAGGSGRLLPDAAKPQSSAPRTEEAKGSGKDAMHSPARARSGFFVVLMAILALIAIGWWLRSRRRPGR